MRFTTLTFLVFFILFYLSYWALPSRRRLVLIFVGSLIFYAAWSVPFALHFLAIVTINHVLINRLFDRPSRSALSVILGINLINLFAFKYFYLFLGSLHDLASLAAPLLGLEYQSTLQPQNFNALLESSLGVPGIVLPLAISFYTFQLMAFAVDVYRGQIKEKATYLEFGVFILFFPQLVAGPIMRHSDFFHQLHENRATEDQTVSGMYLLMQGIIKKVIIADNILPVIAPVFASPEQYDWQSNIAMALGFSARVYCDFSGYTDIARGLGRLLGLDLPENFRAPYLAQSFRDIWQRWHVTLATWIRDYLYIPMGGSRQSELRNFITIFVSFTLAGLWHGAAYTYIVWGAGHGLVLAIERVLRRQRERVVARLSAKNAPWFVTFTRIVSTTPAVVLRRIWMFLVVMTVWNLSAIAFNAPSMTEAVAMWKQIFTAGDGMRAPRMDFIGQMIVVTLLLNFLQLRPNLPAVLYRFRYAGAFVLAIITVYLLGRYSPEGADFIYFQF